ncbi:hypothetical protein AVEN_32800-1 [Araneus ventricosus]|uniref:Uncharacterized protein n=1 Tax=Araneus ventricosus TaxID=182803 RepID=A0A4Y2GG06_ARAVE|nr:hypothetical protein AVEN_196533-1 [Araneus ventricosus]GBM52540.1 hypothetical protein AVEN_32800-1 [Araneus ventricosus]
MYLIIPCDVTTSRARVYKRKQPKGAMTLEFRLQCELRDIESAVTVFTSNLLTVCVAKSERAVTVITSKLLSVCVANLYRNYCSCYLCFVFS